MNNFVVWNTFTIKNEQTTKFLDLWEIEGKKYEFTWKMHTVLFFFFYLLFFIIHNSINSLLKILINCIQNGKAKRNMRISSIRTIRFLPKECKNVFLMLSSLSS